MNTYPFFYLPPGLYTLNFSQAMEITSSTIGFGSFAKLFLYTSIPRMTSPVLDWQ